MPDEPKPNRILDRSGEMRRGVFYEFHVLKRDDYAGFSRSHHEADQKEDVVALRPRLKAGSGLRVGREYIETENGQKYSPWEKLHECRFNAEHITRWYNQDGTSEIHLVYGPLWAPLLWWGTDADYTTLLIEDTAKRLRATSLLGYRLVEQTNVHTQDVRRRFPDFRPEKLFELQFRGKRCVRQFSIVGAPNACPHCGLGPYICPGCGHYEPRCPKCDKIPDCVLKDKKGPEDKRLISAGWDQWCPTILDVKHWDGSDFVYETYLEGINAHIVTRRVVDWLLSFHAAPFVAMPVLACIDGATPEQMQWLARATGPFEK